MTNSLLSDGERVGEGNCKRAQKILFISGFATELKIPSISRDLSQFRGFNFLKKLPATYEIEASFFKWGKACSFSILDTLNPILWLALFKDEQKMTNQTKLQESLAKQIIEGGYDKIVCHSLGARLLINTLDSQYTRDIDFSNTDVYLIQACLNVDKTLKNSSRKVEITNIYCPWDPSLISNILASFEVVNGLRKSNKTKNKFWPLYKTANLHVSSINDQNLLGWIVQDSSKHSKIV
jgi:hypothetical protein